ncbi:hypothetical protein XaC1_505 [Xanthomonas phage XaC1]|nr:hypothetical protein XaC1_505 [Xanthomonas phage XaC1]
MSIEIKEYETRINNFIHGSELLKKNPTLYESIREDAVEYDEWQVDYQDGDFYFAFTDEDEFSWMPELLELLGIKEFGKFAVYFCH